MESKNKKDPMENGTYSFYPFHTIRHLIKNKLNSLADAIGFIEKE